jgi:hypothetical protein
VKIRIPHLVLFSELTAVVESSYSDRIKEGIGTDIGRRGGYVVIVDEHTISITFFLRGQTNRQNQRDSDFNMIESKSLVN